MGNYYWLGFIGATAPIYVIAIAVILLWSKKRLLGFYLFGYGVSVLVNLISKAIIKQPRPNGDLQLFNLSLLSGKRIPFDRYGMPSGHAQTVGYTLAFLYYASVLQNTWITYLLLLISVICLAQRYIYSNHTAFQILVGFVLGGALGALSFLSGKNFIQGKMRDKKDDNNVNPSHN